MALLKGLRFPALSVVIALSAGVSAALAQGPPMSPELKAFLTRPEEQQQYGGMMSDIWRAVIENCPSPQIRGMNVLIDTPPSFNSAGMPVSGGWRVVGQFEGCGKSRTMNVYYLFGADGRMRRVGMLPGSSVADVRLQRDAVTHATMGMAKLAPKDCKDYRYTDTRFLRFEGATPPTPADIGKRGWIEEWTVRACGVTGIVTMNFRPDATGTGISVELDKTRRTEP